MSMKQSSANSLEAFLADVRSGNIEFWIPEQAPEALRRHFGNQDLVINVPYFFVRHLDNVRPQESDALVALALDVLAKADYIKETGKTKGNRVLYTAVRYNGDKADAVVFTLGMSTKRKNRARVHTAYSGNKNTVDSIIRQKNEAAISPHAGDAPGLSKPSK